MEVSFMTDMRRLPDAEFELMQIVWQNPTPISTNQIISHLHNSWKPQTVLTLFSLYSLEYDLELLQNAPHPEEHFSRAYRGHVGRERRGTGGVAGGGVQSFGDKRNCFPYCS